jgi:hypothetical protein
MDAEIVRGFHLQNNSARNDYGIVIESRHHQIQPVITSQPLDGKSFKKSPTLNIIDAQVGKNMLARSGLAFALFFLFGQRTSPASAGRT